MTRNFLKVPRGAKKGQNVIKIGQSTFEYGSNIFNLSNFYQSWSKCDQKWFQKRQKLQYNLKLKLFSGPSCWFKGYPVAQEGKRQSPIDIETAKAVDGSAVTNANPLSWSYKTDHCLNVENTGSSWKVNVNGAGSCQNF